MFREMRRAEKQLPEEEALEMLRSLPHGTLALLGDDGYPYSVPVSQAFKDGKIYFHGATTGHKVDAIAGEPRASFSVIEQDIVVPEKFTTRYRSAIAFGRVRRLTEPAEIQLAMEAIVEKFSPGFRAEGLKYIASAWDRFHAYEMTIERITAKGVERPKGENAGT